MTFKECLSNTHPQFAGAHQHDCQEFLALLLDTMHEELRTLKGKILKTQTWFHGIFSTFVQILQVTVKTSLYNTNLNVEPQWSCTLLIPRKKRPPCQCLGYLGIQVWRITRNLTTTHQRNPKIADRHQWSTRMSMLTCKMVLNPEDQLRQGVTIQGLHLWFTFSTV